MYVCPDHHPEGKTNSLRCCYKLRWLRLGLSHQRPAPHGIHIMSWFKNHHLWPFR